MPHSVLTAAIQPAYVSRSVRRGFGFVGTTGGAPQPPGFMGAKYITPHLQKAKPLRDRAHAVSGYF